MLLLKKKKTNNNCYVRIVSPYPRAVGIIIFLLLLIINFTVILVERNNLPRVAELPNRDAVKPCVWKLFRLASCY